MQLLVQRGQQTFSELPLLPLKPVFFLRVRADLEGNEKVLIEKYRVRDALLYERDREQNVRTTFRWCIGIFVGLSVLLQISGSGFVNGLVSGAIIAVIAFPIIYRQIREYIYIRDVIGGKVFLCRSVVALMEKEELIKKLSFGFRQLLEDMKNWGGEEVLDLQPLRA